MKRNLSLLLTLILTLSLLPSCRDTAQQTPAPSAEVSVPSAEVTMDPTGQYALDQYGEAILTGVSAREAVESGDNARVFYEIFVGSFSDSNGDGIGDLRGIVNRMDYLNDGKPDSGLSLGVEGVWLTPIYPSLSYHKYDVNDYYGVDADFGTLDDLKDLIAACHERNVKLILDLPINHTGPLHDWFLSFKLSHQRNDPSDPRYDWYSWAPEGETDPGRTWRQIEGTGHYYECNFSGDMPELNFDNEAVRQAVLDVAKYYLDMGIDGFRFDAAKYLYYGEQGRNVDFWAWYLAQLRAIKPDVYAVAEVWDADGITDLYYPALDCFDFTLSQTDGMIATTAKGGYVSNYTNYVKQYLTKITSLREGALMIPFIANHDTDRAAGYLTAASGQGKVAANLYLLSPGSPFIYYGEEIGMRGSRGGSNTDANRRLAMVWGDGDTVKNPEGADYDPSSQVKETVADQVGVDWSMFSYYKKLLLIRRSNPEIARGDYAPLYFSDTKAGGFTSTWRGNTVAVLHNPTIHSVTLDLSAAGLKSPALTAVIGVEEASLEGTTLTLGAQTSAVLSVGS